jgi:hypothetical protein
MNPMSTPVENVALFALLIWPYLLVNPLFAPGGANIAAFVGQRV